MKQQTNKTLEVGQTCFSLYMNECVEYKGCLVNVYIFTDSDGCIEAHDESDVEKYICKNIDEVVYKSELIRNEKVENADRRRADAIETAREIWIK